MRVKRILLYYIHMYIQSLDFIFVYYRIKNVQKKKEGKNSLIEE